MPEPLQLISLTRNPEILPDELLEEYEPQGQDPLGEGAFAVVRLLRRRKTGELFALKCVEKYPLQIRNMIGQMQREVRIHKALTHPNILQLVRVFDDNSYLFMLLEYCEKGPLRSIVAEAPNGRLVEAEAAFYFEQIGRGVEWMHRNSCVHRDLKLENMLLTAKDELKICDFGWSAEVEMDKLLKTVCGTTAYWPPELWESEPQDEGVDLWALGCLLYEMLAGHPPFCAHNQKELSAQVLRVQFAYPPWFSKEASHCVHCLLQREPQQRIRSKDLLRHPWLRQLAAAAGPAGAGRPSARPPAAEAPAVPPPAPPPPPPRRPAAAAAAQASRLAPREPAIAQAAPAADAGRPLPPPPPPQASLPPQPLLLPAPRLARDAGTARSSGGAGGAGVGSATAGNASVGSAALGSATVGGAAVGAAEAAPPLAPRPAARLRSPPPPAVMAPVERRPGHPNTERRLAWDLPNTQAPVLPSPALAGGPLLGQHTPGWEEVAARDGAGSAAVASPAANCSGRHGRGLLPAVAAHGGDFPRSPVVRASSNCPQQAQSPTRKRAPPLFAAAEPRFEATTERHSVSPLHSRWPSGTAVRAPADRKQPPPLGHRFGASLQVVANSASPTRGHCGSGYGPAVLPSPTSLRLPLPSAQSFPASHLFAAGEAGGATPLSSTLLPPGKAQSFSVQSPTTSFFLQSMVMPAVPLPQSSVSQQLAAPAPPRSPTRGQSGMGTPLAHSSSGSISAAGRGRCAGFFPPQSGGMVVRHQQPVQCNYYAGGAKTRVFLPSANDSFALDTTLLSPAIAT